MLNIIKGISLEVIKMFLEMAPYIFLGLIFVALLNLLVSKDMITKQIGKNDFWSILKAALFGIPLPLCSCGVVPTAVYMSKSGASKSATVSFLISTPQTGIDSIIATYGMLGPMFAIFRPFAALIMGIAGGLSVKFFDKESQSKSKKPSFMGLNQFVNIKKEVVLQKPSYLTRIKETLHYSFVEFLDDITVQFIAGVIIAGLISYLIPNDYFADSGFNSGILGMLLMVIIGAPMYVCATASIPIAMSLMMKGFTPGVAFVFLAVGPATNAASIAIIGKSLGKRVITIYLLSIALLSIVMGYLLDFIYSVLGENSIIHNHSNHVHSDIFLSDDLKIIIGFIFFIMIILSLYRKYLSKFFNKKIQPELASGSRKIFIEGMTCNHCVATVSKTALNINGVDKIDIHLEEGIAFVSGKFNSQDLIKAISEVGYTAHE